MRYIILSAVGFGLFIFASAALMSVVLGDIFDKSEFTFEEDDETD